MADSIERDLYREMAADEMSLEDCTATPVDLMHPRIVRMDVFDLRRIVTVGLLRTEIRAVARWRALLDTWVANLPADRPTVADPFDEERRMAMAVLLARRAARRDPATLALALFVRSLAIACDRD